MNAYAVALRGRADDCQHLDSEMPSVCGMNIPGYQVTRRIGTESNSEPWGHRFEWEFERNGYEDRYSTVYWVCERCDEHLRTGVTLYEIDLDLPL